MTSDFAAVAAHPVPPDTGPPNPVPPDTGPQLNLPAITRWFRRHGRELPWRHPDAGAWAVLVSEVMLQQTPVARVLEPYSSWMQRWPTPDALAAEPAGAAVQAWGRLGYPRRALRLHAAAAAITERHAGVVPATLDELLALPGVGEYTARAVLAFAYRRRAAVVDTNVRRVLQRRLHGNDDGRPATAADRAELLALLPAQHERAATASAAIMEFGALVCTARQPDCGHCPLPAGCLWLATGRPTATTPRRTQAWAGTDRQVRGRLLAIVRDAADRGVGQVLLPELESAWGEPVQRERCLQSLLADGLLVRSGPAVRLPGH
ncbi:A/G-specific adenine glycosylase [Nakamurella aerolata]|uniref:Adenine DNA glycosylase n=1 Tax=Nakamurella aerolata TaxID=1656892 RepID=A0A849A1T1_9ACTN|nr:A/G-specific adenine glycosylase [Nakamurella aerolata]NNG34994.1 A/G-specific adenine glycosylase [Nakamurella aerolata]